MAERVHIRIEDRFPCRKETFARLTFDDDFNRELHEFLGFRSRTVVRRDPPPDDGSGIVTLRVEYESGVKIPWIVRRLAGREYVAYWEEQRFDPHELVLSTEMEPMILKGRIESTGTMRFDDDPDDDGFMRRTYDIGVSVAVPFAGKPIAARIVQDVEASYVQAAVFINDYIQRNGLTGT